MITVTPFIKSFSISFDPVDDIDWAGYVTHACPASELIDGDLVPTELNRIKTGTDTSFEYHIPTDKIGGNWYVKVAAYDKFGKDELNFSDMVEVYVPSLDPLDPTPPDVPVVCGGTTGLEGTGSSQTAWIKLCWTLDETPADFSNFVVAWKTSGATFWKEEYTTTKEFTLHGCVPGVSYDFQVTAVDIWANFSEFSFIYTIVAAKDTVAPAVPTGLTITTSMHTMFLKWNFNTEDDFKEYVIYEATNSSFTNPTIIRQRSSVFQATGDIGTIYYFKVAAVDFSGNQSAFCAPVSGSPGYVQPADIDNFAIDASKLFSYVPVIKEAMSYVWTGNVPTGGISWKAHTVVYQSKIFSVAAGSTTNIYVYGNFGVDAVAISYQTSNTQPTQANGVFTMAKNTGGKLEVVWNAQANMVIGSAYIMDAAISNAKIGELAADKITSGTLDCSKINVANLEFTDIDGSISWMDIDGRPTTLGDLDAFSDGKLAAAYLEMSDAANDNKLTAAEKIVIKRELLVISSEYNLIIANAAVYGVSSSTYTTAYNALYNYVSPLLANMNITATIVGTTMRDLFKNYYDERTKLLQATITDVNAEATAANTAITAIANDNRLTAVEKSAIKLQWDAIVAEYPNLTTQATTAGVTYTSYASYYSTLSSYITPLLSSMSTTSTIVGTTFRTRFSDYYKEKVDLMLAITAKAKAIADAALPKTDPVLGKLTYIGATGLYSGTINAANITAGSFFGGGIGVGSGGYVTLDGTNVCIRISDGTNPRRVTLGKLLDGSYGIDIQKPDGTSGIKVTKTDAIFRLPITADLITAGTINCNGDLTLSTTSNIRSSSFIQEVTATGTWASTGWKIWGGGLAHFAYVGTKKLDCLTFRAASITTKLITCTSSIISTTADSSYIAPDLSSNVSALRNGVVFGINSYSNAMGVFGYSSGSGSYGVQGKGGYCGVYGGGTGTYGMIGEGVSYDFFANKSNKIKGTVVASFTGAHEGLLSKQEEAELGDILVNCFNINNRDVSQNIFSHTSSNTAKQKNVIGVLGSERVSLLVEVPISLMDRDKPRIFVDEEDTIGKVATVDYYAELAEQFDLIHVNALGDGSINVCKDGGNIEAGDYICSSTRLGKGMKQDDDILHNYTVAKAREDCIWAADEDDIRMLACTYHCG